MASDCRPVPVIQGDSTSAESPLDAIAFLEAVARFLRAIPLYPPGHVRVVAATQLLVEAFHAVPGATVVEVSRGGLLVRGRDAGPLGPGPDAFRIALLQTAVSKVTFQPGIPTQAYVEFALLLRQNSRFAGRGRVTFTDLWSQTIPGIQIEELRFHREGFESGGAGDADAADAEDEDDERSRSYAAALAAGDALYGERASWDGDDTSERRPGAARPATAGQRRTVIGDGDRSDSSDSSGDGSGDGASGTDEGDGSGDVLEARTGRSGASSRPAPSPVRTGALALRRLLQGDAEIRTLLQTAERTLAKTPQATLGKLPAGSDADFLEHLLRLLPVEARLAPDRAREAVRRVLERFVEELAQAQTTRAHGPQAAMLMRALWSIFPRRRDAPRKLEDAPAEPPPALPPDPEDGDLAFLERLGPSHDDPHRVVSLDTAFAAPLVADDGILDLSSILTHAWLLEPVAERRDVLEQRLIEALRSRREDARGPCLVSHMEQLARVAPATADLERIGRIARLAEITGLDHAPELRHWLPEALVVASFPRLLRPYLRVGGECGPVLRRAGRTRVLAAGTPLFDPMTGLDAARLDALLASDSPEAWWVIEALLATDDHLLNARAHRALRTRELPSAARFTLRVLPAADIPRDFLRGLAQDGARGADSHRLDEQAVALVRGCIEDPDLPLASRVYATATLSAFPREVVAPLLRRLRRRRWGILPVLPRAVRRQAATMLKHLGDEPSPPGPEQVQIFDVHG